MGSFARGALHSRSSGFLSAAKRTRPSPYIELTRPSSAAVSVRRRPYECSQKQARRRKCRRWVWSHMLDHERRAARQLSIGACSGTLTKHILHFNFCDPSAAYHCSSAWPDMRRRRRLLSAPLLSSTQSAVKSERGRKSKVRARWSTRNHESYTLIAAEQRRNAVREQEVSGQ